MSTDKRMAGQTGWKLGGVRSCDRERSMIRPATFFKSMAFLVFVLLPFLAGNTGARAACALKSHDGRIKRLVYITFDNLHLRRDSPNVPSDLEQMPNLLNFMLDNGTISGNHHTALISHTAT